MTLHSVLDSYIGNEPYGIPGSISSLTLADTFAELKAAGLCGIKSKRNGVLQPISQRCVLLSCLRSASVRPSLLSRALSTLTLQKSHPLQRPAYSQILALQGLKLLGQRCVLIQNLPAILLKGFVSTLPVWDCHRQPKYSRSRLPLQLGARLVARLQDYNRSVCLPVTLEVPYLNTFQIHNWTRYHPSYNHRPVPCSRDRSSAGLQSQWINIYRRSWRT